MQNIEKRKRLYRRRMRVRAKIKGTSKVPRLSVYRSLKHIYAQIIDDEKGVTLISANDREIKDGKDIVARKQNRGKQDGGKVLSSKGRILAFALGRLVADKALKNGIKKIVFDRGGRAYHGQIKAVAEGARAGGLKF